MTTSTQYDSFIRKLKEIFMMDQADLDFGIYRIMNQKRRDIQQFLEHDLLPQVKQILKENNPGAEALQQELNKTVQALREMGVNPDEATKVQQLKAQIAASGDLSELENEVYSHLTTFFSRYYNEGDFISKRRYKDNTYAIPYNGEEVKLHWANADQYYIKTSENFKDYSFRLSDSRLVHFTLKDATTEQNNNKAQNNQERRFMLFNDEESEMPTVETVDGELHIYFTYELTAKTNKQKDINAQTLDTLRTLIPEEWAALLAPVSDADSRTLVEKHLTDYTAKNTFDYFIHKDLGSFLRRELDFYIKNEVLHIDDLDTQHIESQIATVKAIKGVGEKIIRMLAQLEDFQKKLWLKKKFVVQTDYCITLDRVPRSLYAEICKNDAQREEWVRLFAVDEIKDDLIHKGFSVPLTEQFLEENPFLVLDTAFFSSDFKHRLVSDMKDIDENFNGLLINSENFQALELLQEKYREGIKCIYIDPPYNTEGDDFLYKDCFRTSSWLTMLQNRLALGKNILNLSGVFFTSIDDNEVGELKVLLKDLFGEENFEGHIHWRRRTNQPNDKTKMLGLVAEHLLSFAKSYEANKKEGVGKLALTGEFSNPDDDIRGPWASKPWKAGSDQSGCRYVITTPKGVKYDEEWLGEENTFKTLLADNRIYFPNNGKGSPRKKYYKSEREEEGQCATNWWPHEMFGSNQGANADMTNILGEKNKFSNPKPVELVSGVIQVTNRDLSNIVLDYFAGSGTTGHAVINLNREDNGNRKYILCEMAEYFKSVTKPRIEKVIYSKDWKNGKPVSRDGISQCFKYIRLEQYEDTLNNLVVEQPGSLFDNGEDDGWKETYMLGYMMDTETKGSLFNMEWFKRPFNMTLKTTRNNELVETPVDMVETFNFLIGMEIYAERWHHEGHICVVEGRLHRTGESALVIWRDCEFVSNDALNEFFRKKDYTAQDRKFDVIYVNGDNTLPNLRRDEDNWKVVLTEEEFKKRMFEEE